MPEIVMVIAADVDDGFINEDTAAFDNTGDVDIEARDVGGGRTKAFFRFVSAAIPDGATIDSAFLSLRSTFFDDIAADMYVAVGDTVAPTSIAEYQALTKSTATVAWIADDNGTVAYADSPDFAAAIQENVDDVGWVEDNAIIVMVEGRVQSTVRRFRAGGFTNANKPTLTINYTEASLGGGASLPAIMHHRRLMGVS